MNFLTKPITLVGDPDNERRFLASLGLFCVATMFVFLPICAPALHAYEVAPIEAPPFFAGSAAAIGLGLCASFVVMRLVGKVYSKIATRRRRLKALAALPPARTRREKLEALKGELEAAEKAERDRLEEEGRKIEAKSDWIPLAPIYNGDGFAPLPETAPVVKGPGNLTLSTKPGVRVEITDQGALLLGRGQVPFDSEIDTALEGGWHTSILGGLNWLWREVRALGTRISALERRNSALWEIPHGNNRIAGRPRKEPLWERRVFTAGTGQTIFFDGTSCNADGSPVQKNMYGSCGGLPSATFFYWYTLSVRFDAEPPADWLACAKISFAFSTSRLLTLPLGVVHDAGQQGRSVTVMDKPVELSAMEDFTVRVETEGYRGPSDTKIGLTVCLNGILVRGVSA